MAGPPPIGRRTVFVAYGTWLALGVIWPLDLVWTQSNARPYRGLVSALLIAAYFAWLAGAVLVAAMTMIVSSSGVRALRTLALLAIVADVTVLGASIGWVVTLGGRPSRDGLAVIGYLLFLITTPVMIVALLAIGAGGATAVRSAIHWWRGRRVSPRSP